MKIKDFVIELRCVKNDLEDVQSQIGAILRDVDMVLGDYDDPTNVDTDPPDEEGLQEWLDRKDGFDVFENEDGHDCKATVDGG